MIPHRRGRSTLLAPGESQFALALCHRLVLSEHPGARPFEGFCVAVFGAPNSLSLQIATEAGEQLLLVSRANVSKADWAVLSPLLMKLVPAPHDPPDRLERRTEAEHPFQGALNSAIANWTTRLEAHKWSRRCYYGSEASAALRSSLSSDPPAAGLGARP